MNIKVEWKGKVHKLASTLQSIDDIVKDVRGRYPNHFKNGMTLAWIDANGKATEVKSWEQLKEIGQKTGTASIKLKVIDGELPENYDNLASSVYSRKESKDETGVFQVVDLEKQLKEMQQAPREEAKKETVRESMKQESAKEERKYSQVKIEKPEQPRPEPVKVVLMEEKVQQRGNHKEGNQEKKEQKYKGRGYMCYVCKGSVGRNCEVCLGRGGVEEGNPFLAFIDQIVTDKIAKALGNIKVLNEVEKPKQEKVESIVEEKKPELPKTIHRYSFRFLEEPDNRMKFVGATQFLWTLKIANNGQSEWPERVYLYQILKGGKYEPLVDIRQVKPKQKTYVSVGFKLAKDTVETYEMRIGFIDKYEGVVFFGPKIGFQVDTIEPKPVERLITAQQKMRYRVEDAIKKVKHQKHPMPYLLKHMQNLGLDYKTPEQLIIEVIQSLQSLNS